MDYNRETAKSLYENGDVEKALQIYKVLWEQQIGKSVDCWLGWEYACTFKKAGKIDEAIAICKKVYQENKKFKYINDLLSWCLYEKYLKDIKDTNKPKDISQIVAIANFITHITCQDSKMPYEKSVWKVIKLYKNPFNGTEINFWLDKLNVDLLSEESYCITLNGKKIELASNKEEWYYLKCKALSNMGHFKECIKLCEIALLSGIKFHNDRDVWIEREKAHSIAATGDKENAVNLLKQLLLKKEHWTIYKEIFQIKAELGNYDEALFNAYTAALTRDPPRVKVNLYFDIGRVLEIKGEYECALMHYLFSKEIRKNEQWNVSEKLQNYINRLEVKHNIITDNLFEGLKKFWLNEKFKCTKRYKGTIMRLLPNHKAGFIKSNSESYYFRTNSVLNNNYIKESMVVTFSLIDSIDMKKNVKTKEAIDILLEP